MSVERLTNKFDVDKATDFTIITGAKNEQFILSDLQVVNDEQLIWHYLKGKGYTRIWFYSPGIGLYFLDEDSALLPKAISSGNSSPVLKNSGFKRQYYSSPDRQNNINSHSENNENAAVRYVQQGYRYVAIGHDNENFGRTVTTIFYNHDDSEKRAMIFIDFDQAFQAASQEREKIWDVIWNMFSNADRLRNFTSHIKYFFLYQGVVEEQIVHHINYYAMILKPLIDNIGNAIKSEHIVHLGSPEEDEIMSLINRYRLLGDLKMDWINYDHIVQGIFNERKSLNYWINEFHKPKYTSISYSELIKAKLIKNPVIEIDFDRLREDLVMVRGQEENVSIICSRLKNWIDAPSGIHKPASFLAVGTSGVGKTFTAKQISKSLSNNGFEYVEFNMNEYMQEHTVTNLIGTAEGYVGIRPRLFEALDKSSRLVICFDEIEKAHPSIIIALMQLIDQGTLRWRSEEGNFKECIIFFTSNLERDKVVQVKNNLLSQIIGKSDYAKQRDKILKSPKFKNSIRKIFNKSSLGVPPELWNRIDSYLVYNKLSASDFIEIAINNINKLASDFNITLGFVDPYFLAKLAFNNYTSADGARDLLDEINNGQIKELFSRHRGEQIELIEGDSELIAQRGTQTSNNKESVIQEAIDALRKLERKPIDFDLKRFISALSKIYAQDDNIVSISKSVNAWIRKSKKPRPLSLFFSGTTGVGKTFTAELIASEMESLGYSYCYLPMTEYNSEGDTWKFLGSSTGYVGSEQEPVLFKAHSLSSKLVILFDEIEKAHSKLFDSIMQLLDKGELSWNADKRDFKECIIIFTSNLAVEEINSTKNILRAKGFQNSDKRVQSAIKDVLKKNGLRNELCGRINLVLAYNTLDIDSIIKISMSNIHKLADEYGLHITNICPEVLAQITKECKGSNQGARPIIDSCENILGSLFAENSTKEYVEIECTSNDCYQLKESKPSQCIIDEQKIKDVISIVESNSITKIIFNEVALKSSLSRVYCQNDNINLLLKTVKLWIKMPQKDKPLCLFFAGTSGVGKTFSAELLSQGLKSSNYDYCYLPMSEFQNEADTWKLLGSTTGYVGSNEEPKLFKAQRYSKQLVIVFDEIEKAHTNIFTSLMQLLDKGELSWNNDKRDFRECIIIFTSNLAMNQLIKTKQQLIDQGLKIESVGFQEQIKTILKNSGIKNEVSGRINRVFVFNVLDKKSAIKISIAESRKLALKYGLQLNFICASALIKIANDCAGSDEGARPIQNMCSLLFAELLVDNMDIGPIIDIVCDENGYNIIKSSEPILSVEELTDLTLSNDNSRDVISDDIITNRIDTLSINSNYSVDFKLSNLKQAVGYIEAEGSGSGSGFVVNKEGYVLTCHHVIENASAIKVYLNDSTVPIDAECVYTNKTIDLAILKLNSKEEDEFEYFALISEDEVIEELTPIALRGYPLGRAMGDESGIWDGTVNGTLIDEKGCKLIKNNIDATHGASGGPVFRISDGKVVGFLSSGAANVQTRAASYNFAVDIRQIYSLEDLDIILSGKVSDDK